ncbi:hypothetical protein BH11PAT1_BH11PAT1_6520 [soil metagenome]
MLDTAQELHGTSSLPSPIINDASLYPLPEISHQMSKAEFSSLAASRERLLGISRWKLTVQNSPEHSLAEGKGMKDPVFMRRPDGHIIGLGTTAWEDVGQIDIPLYTADSLKGPLTYHGSVLNEFYGKQAPEFCAPGSLVDPESGKIISAVQRSCFAPGSAIDIIESSKDFTENKQRVIFDQTDSPSKEVIYDPHLGVYFDEREQKWVRYMTFNKGPFMRKSDVYLATFPEGWFGQVKVQTRPILKEEDIPLHNRTHVEWNTEGSQLVYFGRQQLSGLAKETDKEFYTQDDLSPLAVAIGVLFLEPGALESTHEDRTRQRVLMGFSRTVGESLTMLDLPLLDPATDETDENGHPSFVTQNGVPYIDEEGKAFIAYQGRKKNGPWELYMLSLDVRKLVQFGNILLQGQNPQIPELQEDLMLAAD